MRHVLFGLVALTLASAASAQPAAPPAPKLFTSAGDLTAMIAKAKAERKPDQANFAQPILTLAPYNASLEYRVGGINANATLMVGRPKIRFDLPLSGQSLVIPANR